MTNEYKVAQSGEDIIIIPQSIGKMLGPYASHVLSTVPFHTVFIDPRTYKDSSLEETSAGLARFTEGMGSILGIQISANPDSFKAVAAKVRDGNPFATSTSIRGMPLGFVQLPDSHNSENIISVSCIQDEDRNLLRRIPFHDAAALVTLHEIGHLTDDPESSTLQNEVKNDRFAIRESPASLPNSSCESFLATRALNSIHYFKDTHATAPYIIWPEIKARDLSASRTFHNQTREYLEAGLTSFEADLKLMAQLSPDLANSAGAFYKLTPEERMQFVCEAVHLSPTRVCDAVVELQTRHQYEGNTKLAAASYLSGYGILTSGVDSEESRHNIIARAVRQIRSENNAG